MTIYNTIDNSVSAKASCFLSGRTRGLTLAVSGGPHGQPHAGHGCPLWPVRSSALFGGGSALVLATSPRSQGAPAESRRPPTAGTVSVPIEPPAHPRTEGYRASPTTRRAGHRTLAVSRRAIYGTRRPQSYHWRGRL